MGKADRGRAKLADARSFVAGVYGDELHAKRIASLAGATLGVMRAASLAVAIIGQALAQARGLVTRHAIKQVDRLLSNTGIDVWESFARWIPHQIGAQRDVLVAMDWTDFDHDDQATLMLSLVTGHGRAAPLLYQPPKFLTLGVQLGFPPTAFCDSLLRLGDSGERWRWGRRLR